MLVKNYKKFGFILAFGLLTVACGDEDEEKKTTTTSSAKEVGGVDVTPAKDGAITLSFSGAADGSQYVVVPYYTANLNTVNGATKETSSVTVKQGTALHDPSDAADDGYARQGARSLQGEELDLNNIDEVRRELEVLARFVGNRFYSSRSAEDQEPGVWAAARQYDFLKKRYLELQPEKHGLLPANEPSFELSLQEMIAKKANAFESTSALDAGEKANLAATCPSTVPAPKNQGKKTVASVVAGNDYCLLIVDELASTTETQANVKATIEAAMKTYKETIYGDQMSAEKGGITFNPYFVVMDFSSIAGYKEVFGFFDPDSTEEAGRPVLYIINDMKKVGKTPSDKTKGEYHALIAHELQHGILYYFKGKSDVFAIDEGIAHLMEDVFGYREYGNFSAHTQKFLDFLAEDPAPYLATDAYWTGSASEADTKLFYRGGGEAFFYYLASQKGGFSFTSNVISGGAGLKFIADVVKASGTGLANVSTVYASKDSWTTVVGNYIAALYLDNSGISGVATSHEVQAPVEEVKNLQGATKLGSTKNGFGMRFNDWNGLSKKTNDVVALSSNSFTLAAYQGKPFLFKPTSSANKVTIDLAADNAAAITIRIK